MRRPARPSRTDPGPASKSVAGSVDAPTSLAPWLGVLFEGIDSLGTENSRIVRSLDRFGISADSKIVDVGCGKGSLALRLGQRLGARTLGVDACPAFIDEAKRRARGAGLGRTCRFLVADFRNMPARSVPEGSFNVGLMLGVAPWRRSRQLMRRLVRPGGIYVLDDACVRQGLGKGSLAEARRGLERQGDAILAEDPVSPARVRAMESKILRRLARNARALARERPELERALEGYLERQRAAAGELAGALRPVVWYVWRGG